MKGPASWSDEASIAGSIPIGWTGTTVPPTIRGRRVGRCHVGQANTSDSGKALGIQAMGIHRDRQSPRAGGLEAAPRHQVAGVLEDKGVIRIQQHARTQVDGLLRAVHDDDLLGVTVQSAGAPEITLHRAAQRGVAFGRRVVQPRKRYYAPTNERAARPVPESRLWQWRRRESRSPAVPHPAAQKVPSSRHGRQMPTAARPPGCRVRPAQRPRVPTRWPHEPRVRLR